MKKNDETIIKTGISYNIEVLHWKYRRHRTKILIPDENYICDYADLKWINLVAFSGLKGNGTAKIIVGDSDV